MKRKNIDDDLQIRVRKYLEYIWNEEKTENNAIEEEILNKLSSNLREEVLIKSQGGTLKSFPMFVENFSEDTLRKLIQIIKQVRFTPEEFIFEEGFVDDESIYLIAKGEVEIILNAQKREEGYARISVLSTGQTFGEISFFTEQARTVTARSLNFCTAYQVKRSDFMDIIRNNPADYEMFCMIRDQILLYGSVKMLENRCYSCKEKNHFLNKCPRVNYVPDRDFLVKRFNQKSKFTRDDFQKKFKRKKRKVTLHSLKDHAEIAQSNAWFQVKEKETIDERLFQIIEHSEEENDKKDESEDEESEKVGKNDKFKEVLETAATSSSETSIQVIQQRNLNRKPSAKLTHKRTFDLKKSTGYKDEEDKSDKPQKPGTVTKKPLKSGRSIQVDAEEKPKAAGHILRKRLSAKTLINTDRLPLHEKDDLNSPDMRSHKENYANSLALVKEHGKYPQIDYNLTKEERRILEYYYAQMDNEQGDLFDYNFDKIWITEKYFPHNNSDTIIDKMLTKKALMRKKAKQEKRSFLSLKSRRQSMKNAAQSVAISGLKNQGTKSFEVPKLKKGASGNSPNNNIFSRKN